MADTATIRCPLDDCGWAFDPAPSTLGADLSDTVREMIQNCRDQAVGYELRRHFAGHDPRDVLRTIGRLTAEHVRVADALAEIAVKLRDNRAPGEDIVATVLRIRDERDSLAERLAELDESRFAWAAEADRLDVALAARRGFPPDWAARLGRCTSSAEGVDLVQAWLQGVTSKETGEDLNPRPDGSSLLEPERVAVCGSMRFWPLMLRVASDLTSQGVIVLAPFVTVEPDQQDSAAKKALDELHRAKIRMADRVVVVSDESGYYGESTRGEIEYVLSLGLPVSFQTVEAEVET